MKARDFLKTLSSISVDSHYFQQLVSKLINTNTNPVEQIELLKEANDCGNDLLAAISDIQQHLNGADKQASVPAPELASTAVAHDIANVA